MFVYVKDKEILGISEKDILFFEEKDLKVFEIENISDEIINNLKKYKFDKNTETFYIDTEIEKKLEKEENIDKIRSITEKYIKMILYRYDYSDIGELSLYKREESIWKKESDCLSEFIEEVYKKMYEFIEENISFKNIKYEYDKILKEKKC